MPKNYREIDFEIDGEHVKVAGMARAAFENQDPEEVFQFLSDNHYTTMISLQPNEMDEALAKNRKSPIEYIKQEVDDFKSPGIIKFEAIYERIRTGLSNPKEKIVICCGEGFGRTGTVLAALKLKELMLAQAIPVEQQVIDKNKTSDIKLGKHAQNPGLFNCTPMVQEAIKAIRDYPDSSNSVETEAQVNQLKKYQDYIIQKQNEENKAGYRENAELIQNAYLTNPEDFSLENLTNMLNEMYSSEKYKAATPEMLLSAKSQVVLLGLISSKDRQLNQMLIEVLDVDVLLQKIEVDDLAVVFSAVTEVNNNFQDNEKCNHFHEALNQKLEACVKGVKNMKQFSAALQLHSLDEAQFRIVLGATKETFKKTVMSDGGLIYNSTHLDDTRFKIILDVLKDDLKTMITSASKLSTELDHCSGMHREEV
ncbi:MAG: hypothetical protein QNK11_04400, partial [Legionella sp.]|nr:hypothetical protein [Legionella sp.]